MNDNDKRASFLFDALIVGSVLFTIAMLSGCKVDPKTAPTGEGNAFTTEYSSAVFTDDETGCQYLGYSSHGLTPRMSRYEDGKQTHMGCHQIVRMADPMTGLKK